ncbi:MAG: hypothetical protein GY821_16580 [Gammaproteobacteria bacterium]|nr:hypothetical protein [Gammaproteobacteria bacterium]
MVDDYIDMTSSRDCQLNWLFEDIPVRGIAVQLSQSLEQISAQHNYVGPLKQLLASFLAYSVLLRASYKESGKLIVQLQNDGPLSLVVAQCRDNNEISGVIRWRDEAEMDTLKLTQGRVIVTLMRSGNLTPYQSIVPYQTEDLATALSVYFQQSDQVLTRFYCMPNDHAVFAMVLQTLPDNGELSETLFEQRALELERCCHQAVPAADSSILLTLQNYLALSSLKCDNPTQFSSACFSKIFSR